MLIYTIGHSNHKIEKFIQLLQNHGIDCICDVRSTPYSRFAGQYNRENLKVILEKHNIRYLFFGEEFGARREEKNLLTDGLVDFEKVAKSEKFLSGIIRIEDGIKKGYNIALMCSEKEPIECHRTILVSRNLNSKGIEVQHILSDGALKKHELIEYELIKKYFNNINQFSLFDSEGSTDCLLEAYRKANYEIGYRKENEQQ